MRQSPFYGVPLAYSLISPLGHTSYFLGCVLISFTVGLPAISANVETSAARPESENWKEAEKLVSKDVGY